MRALGMYRTNPETGLTFFLLILTQDCGTSIQPDGVDRRKRHVGRISGIIPHLQWPDAGHFQEDQRYVHERVALRKRDVTGGAVCVGLMDSPQCLNWLEQTR